MGIINSELFNFFDRRYFKFQFKNLFIVNDEYDVVVALYWLENYFFKFNSKQFYKLLFNYRNYLYRFNLNLNYYEN